MEANKGAKSCASSVLPVESKSWPSLIIQDELEDELDVKSRYALAPFRENESKNKKRISFINNIGYLNYDSDLALLT